MKSYYVFSVLVGCSVEVSEPEFKKFVDRINRHDPHYTFCRHSEYRRKSIVTFDEYYLSNGDLACGIIEYEDKV